MKTTPQDWEQDNLSQLLTPTPPIESRILRPSPEDHSFFSRKYDDTYKDEIELETRLQIDETKMRFKSGRWSFTGADSYAIQTKVRQKYEALHLAKQLQVAMWVRSERILNLLRTKGLTPKPDDTTITKAFLRLVEGLQHSYFPEMDVDSAFYIGPSRSVYPSDQPKRGTPNQYFNQSQGELVSTYGYAFYSAVPKTVEIQHTSSIQHVNERRAELERITGLNTDFFGAFLGGDKRLGHDVVYYVPEQCWYFFDLVLETYVPTTQEKLLLGLFQTLQARAFGLDVEEGAMILDRFRTKAVFNEIITKSKAILAAERGFFQGPDAKPRWIDQQEPRDVGADFASFVREQLEPAEGEVLTLSSCLDRFDETRTMTLTRKETAERINDAIRAGHNIGLRNDLVLNGRGVKGWSGLRLRGCPESGEHLEKDGFVRESDLSVESEAVEVVSSPSDMILSN